MNTTSPKLLDEVCELLEFSVTDVFSTMLGTATARVEAEDIRQGMGSFLAASVGFVGDVGGIVHIYMKASFARTLAGRLLGLEDADTEDDEITGDAIGELSNMIVGSVKSRLCDNGTACKLTIPSIMRGEHLSTQPVCSEQSQLLTISCGDELILLELVMKPSQ